jgi:hypothetical protein
MTDDKSETLPITRNGGNLSFVHLFRRLAGGCRIITELKARTPKTASATPQTQR